MTTPLEQVRAELREGQYLGASPVVAALIDIAEAAQRVRWDAVLHALAGRELPDGTSYSDTFDAVAALKDLIHQVCSEDEL